MKGTIFSVCSRNTLTDILQSWLKNTQKRTHFAGRWSRRVHRGVFPGGLTVYSTVSEQTSLNETLSTTLAVGYCACRLPQMQGNASKYPDNVS